MVLAEGSKGRRGKKNPPVYFCGLCVCVCMKDIVVILYMHHRVLPVALSDIYKSCLVPEYFGSLP